MAARVQLELLRKRGLERRAQLTRSMSRTVVVHLATMLKVDVFLRKGRAFDAQSFERVIRRPLDTAEGARGRRARYG